ncbi:MAG: hypothetical protein QXP55_02735 [Nitrososphaerales archaeon]
MQKYSLLHLLETAYSPVPLSKLNFNVKVTIERERILGVCGICNRLICGQC